MQIVGFMEDEVQSVLELVAAVLKLGNIEFKPESRCNGTDESRIKDKNGGLGETQEVRSHGNPFTVELTFIWMTLIDGGWRAEHPAV